MTSRRRLRLPPRFRRGLVAAVALVMGAALPVGAAERAAQPGSPSVQAQKSKPAAKTKRKSTRQRKSRRPVVPAVPSTGTKLGLHKTRDELALKSGAALVIDQDTGETVALKNPDVVLPIASLTKLMTALVVLESGLPMDEMLEIADADVDRQRNTRSRLTVGTKFSRDDLMLLALMSSENRAASALGRHYPGGREAFLRQMNNRALSLGMAHTRFGDTAGLSNGSVSTARDLHLLVSAAYAQPLIREYSTRPDATVRGSRGRPLKFVNSNRLVRKKGGDWEIGLQKTGFTNEAGRCLVMQATVLSRRLSMIFLDSSGTMTRYADAARVRKKLEKELRAKMRSASPASG